ncbi:MAG: hypothetical protein VB138_01145 [Burkholderia sp.]
MSVQTSVRVAGPFDGNDLTTDFGFEFVIFQATDLLAIKTGIDDIELPLVKDVDYTVTLNDSTPGGTVSLMTPLATGEKLTLTSDLQATQGLQIPNLSAFHPQTLERALDKLTILVQQLADKIARTVQAPISGGTSAQQLLEQLAAQLPLVAAVYTHLAYIQAVATNQANVDAVAVSIDPINAIAADMSGTWQDGVKYDYGNCTDPIAGGTVDAVGNIVTVAGNMDDVNMVAANIADVGTVSLHISAVDTVAADIASVNSVVADQDNIDAVAGDLANIDTVAGSIASVNAVAADLGNIDAVLANQTNIDAVAGNQVNIDVVANNMADVNALVADQANVDAVAAALGDVDTVATSIADVNAVADNQTAISAVAVDLQGAPVAIDYGNASAPTNPASPTGVLAAVYSNASNITAVAQQIAAVQTVATNLAAILAALSGGLTAANNLSELTNPAAARAHLGLVDLGTAAP